MPVHASASRVLSDTLRRSERGLRAVEVRCCECLLASRAFDSLHTRIGRAQLPLLPARAGGTHS